MKKKKLLLENLKIKSFITNIDKIKGGNTEFNTLQEIATDCGCQLETDELIGCNNGNSIFCIPENSIEIGCINKNTRGISCNCVTIQC